MKRLLHCASFLFVLFSAGVMLAENTHFNCVPSFPFQQEWQGADAAYSIPLQDGRVAWIFGDTLYGDERLVTGEEPRMVHNTIGISTCKDGKWKIDYTIKKDAKGNPDSFFKPQQNNGTYYWALDGVEHNQELWITLVCVRNVPNSNAFALGFEICGTDLAHVTGLESDPQKWKVAYFPLVAESVHANPSASALIEDDYLYIYTLYEVGSRPQILTRIPLQGLGDPRKNLQYLGSDDKWHDGIEPAKAKIIMKTGASEMSVRYHPELKKWIAVMVDPQIFSDKVILRTVAELDRPVDRWRSDLSHPDPAEERSEIRCRHFLLRGQGAPRVRATGRIAVHICVQHDEAKKAVGRDKHLLSAGCTHANAGGREEIVNLREHVCRRRECAGRVVSNTASHGRRETLHRHEARAIR